MSEEQSAPPPAEPKDELVEIASKPDVDKPSSVSQKAWRKARIRAGQMVIIRSHFKSIYLIPMALISLVLAIWAGTLDPVTPGGDPHPTATALGLVWMLAFVLYMSLFLFEWSRPGFYALFITLGALLLIGWAFNEQLGVFQAIGGWLRGLQLIFSSSAYYTFAVFFGLCALVSFIRTRMNYVIVESNEVQLYRNSLFGDRERIPMLNLRLEVRVPDMMEYLHPFYHAGQIVLHTRDRSIVLDNVLHIRRIEEVTNRLGSALRVRSAEADG